MCRPKASGRIAQDCHKKVAVNDAKGNLTSPIGAVIRWFRGASEAQIGGKVVDSQPTDLTPSNKRALPTEHEVYNHVARYAKPDDVIATWVTVQTVVVFWSLWWIACTYEGPLKWPVVLACVAIAGLTRTRVFCVFHDMAHHSFFSNKFMNQAGATLLGWIVYTPYTGWKKGHDYHHRHSNNTERKQFAQTAPLTAQQFLQLTPLQRLGYKLVYGQWSLVSITPTFYFIVYQRLISAWYENLMVAAYWTWLYSYGGSRFMAVDVVTMLIGASLGVFLFHIQHSFEGAYKSNNAQYSRFENGLRGSSFLIIPEALKFFTAAIEYHHVHHLNTRVPLYRLRQCHEEGAALFAGVPTFTLPEACARLRHGLRLDETREFLECYDDYVVAEAVRRAARRPAPRARAQ